MIRFNVGDLPLEISLRRLAAQAAMFVAWCVWFDVIVWIPWVDVPVELGFGLLLEWAFPTVHLYAVMRSALDDLREIRRLRAERKAGE